MQIKLLINKSGFVNTIIVGHSGDDEYHIIQLFLKSGAEFFECKPTNFKRMKKFFEDNIDNKDILKYAN